MTNETLFLKNLWSHFFKWSGCGNVVILKNVVIGYEYSVFMFQFFLINYKPNSYTVWVDWSSNQLLSIGLCYPYISYLLTEIIHNFFAVRQAKSVQLIFITINIEIFNHNRPEKSEIGQANEIEKSGKFVAKMVLASWEMLALLKIKETYEKPVARINGRIWDANANLSH